MSARSRRLDGSLGSSWAEADYASDEGGSIDSISDEASEVELEGSDKETADRSKRLSPRVKQKGRSSKSTQPPVTPIRKPASKTQPRQSQSLESSRSTPRATKSTRGAPRNQQQIMQQSEPSFIMPSMNNTPISGSRGSQAQDSQIRFRQTTQQNLPTGQESPRYRSQDSVDSQARKKQEQEEVSPLHYLKVTWLNVVWPLLAQVLELFSYATRHVLKPILGTALGIGIIFFISQLALGMLRSSLTNAIMTPVCLIPGSSYVIPACATTDNSPHADFEELINVQGHFEDIVEASKDTTTLPSYIKSSELAIRDLRTLVRYSRLPSRQELDHEFEFFVQTANEASVDLSRYNALIGASMDRVIATNTWTMNVLHGLEDAEDSTGAVSRAFNSLTGAFISPAPTLQQRIFDQYLLHIGRNKAEITGLIDKAQALLLILNNLDDRLHTIFEIAMNDDNTISRNHEELCASLWTKLGGNRGDVRANEKSKSLLRNIESYRRKAVIHVSQTLIKLQEIQAELENLRDNVAAPEVLGHRAEMPLRFYVGVIEQGVERLRVTRGESMRVEGENYRRLMKGGEGSGVRELDAPVVTVRAK